MTAPFFIILALGRPHPVRPSSGRLGSVPRVSAAAAGLVVAMGLKMAASRRLRSAMALFAVITFIGIALMRLLLSCSSLPWRP